MLVHDSVNIAIYTTSDYPEGGAAENFVRQMALGLCSAGSKVNIVLLRGHYLERNSNDSRILCECLLFKRRISSEFLKFIELLLIILAIPFSVIKNRVNNKTKIIILYGVEYFYLVLPFYLVGKITGVKVYRIVTDRYINRGIAPTWWKKPKIFFYQFQYRYFDRFLSGVVCLSHYLYQNSICNGVKEERICIIPHFIDVDFFSKGSCNFMPFQGEKIRIGICGTLNENNGLFYLLNAFLLLKKDYHDIELILIGSISKKDIIGVKNKISSVLESVTFTGKVERSKIPNLLLTCDILVNPRISGTFAEAGFPTKLGEYLSTKRPVVATSVGDIKQYFEKGNQLVLVESNSSQTLVDGISFLIKNKEEAINIGLNGYYWAKERLDYKQNALKVIDFVKG